MKLRGNSDDTIPRECELQLVSVGQSVYGILNNRISAIVDWTEPAPLPHAPPAVMGVVSVQGRMLTVLNLAGLPAVAVTAPIRRSANKIIALKGDEQLALAVDAIGDLLRCKLKGTAGKSDDFVSEKLDADGREVTVLNVDQLFAAAIQGRERRRRRF